MRITYTTICLSITARGGTRSLAVQPASGIWPSFTNVAGKQAIAEAPVKEALQRTKIRASTEILEIKRGVTRGFRF